jgi:hypothetical protein
LVIRLQPGIDLSGQVVDSEGAGVSEARVTLMDGRRGVAGGVVLDSAWSEADGTFLFSAQPSAKLFVTAHHFHFAPARSGLVTVAEGAYLTAWWRVPCPTNDWPRVVACRVNGAWVSAERDRQG